MWDPKSLLMKIRYGYLLWVQYLVYDQPLQLIDVGNIISLMIVL